MNKKLLLLLLVFPFLSTAQNQKEYQGLLWKISGNGLEHPSYLYGTMHVSNRVAFHLSESFFHALDSAEVVALETNPEFWISDLASSELFQEIYDMNFLSARDQFPLYSTFIPKQPLQNELAYYLANDQDMLNGLLWRFNQGDQDFEENTFLDLFIYQAGKKLGKEITALEDFEGSFKSVMMSGKRDKDARQISERQARDILGDFSNWMELQEDAYRKGDLDLLDTIGSALNPGKYHRLYMLDERNHIMAEAMDSIMRDKRLFTGVGAAHLPGENGVINLLRGMGYTVEAEDRTITTQSIEEKEEIDELYFSQPMQPFISEDKLIRTTVPGELSKVVAAPHQEYLFADMANGAFYLIKRIKTFAPVYGKGTDIYRKKVDSLLFENIPGKILSRKDSVISGYPAIDIQNKTSKGDQQRYLILFTPIELIIVKAGGHKDFIQNPQPTAFFNELKLGVDTSNAEMYSPASGAYRVKMPAIHRTENYEGIYYNPHNTFWTQAMDEEGDYYATAYRQFYDYDYIEEDGFELEYFVESIANEDKLEIDTIYEIKRENPARSFVLKSSTGPKVYGEIHLHGARYLMMLTTDKRENQREEFFGSLQFTAPEYPDKFVEYVDTALLVKMISPRKLNNYNSFINNIYANSAYSTGSTSKHEGSETIRQFMYKPTGEQVEINFIQFHKYLSYDTDEELWEDFKKDYNQPDLILEKEELLHSEIRDTSYFKQIKLFHFTDTNSSRNIWKKVVIENGAAWILSAVVADEGPTPLVEKAFASFDNSGDTVFGGSILHSKSRLFFDDLESKDSIRVHSAKSSIYSTSFDSDDGERIKQLFETYRHPDFKREDRLKLLNRLAFIDDEEHIDYLTDLYYKNLDSAAYQFGILETLADYETRRANKEFLRLILDETPFSSNEYEYASLINELDDSIQIVDIVFPDLLELTDFEDYKPHIYSLLSSALDSGAVEAGDYKKRYSTILRYAKVELKKQKASDENKDKSSYNQKLGEYVNLLRPFARKKEVRELFQGVLEIKNKSILLNQVKLVKGHTEIPDSIYNYIASDEKVLYEVYDFLKENEQNGLIHEKYRSQQAIAKSLAQNVNYSVFDTISFIESQTVEVKGISSEAYFFRARKSDDDFWSLVYVVFPHTEDGTISTEAILSQSGESFNPAYDDMGEIIEDALKEIRIFGRERAQQNQQDYYWNG